MMIQLLLTSLILLSYSGKIFANAEDYTSSSETVFRASNFCQDQWHHFSKDCGIDSKNPENEIIANNFEFDSPVILEYELILSYENNCQFSDNSEFFVEFEGDQFALKASHNFLSIPSKSNSKIMRIGLIVEGSHVLASSIISGENCFLKIFSANLIPKLGSIESHIAILEQRIEDLKLFLDFFDTFNPGEKNIRVEALLNARIEELWQQCLTKVVQIGEMTLLPACDGTLSSDLPTHEQLTGILQDLEWLRNLQKYISCPPDKCEVDQGKTILNIMNEEIIADLESLSTMITATIDLIEDSKSNEWANLQNKIETFKKKLGAS